MVLSPETLLGVGCVSALAALGVVYAVACTVRDAVDTHDLKIRAISLRNERIAYLRELHATETVVTSLNLPGVNSASPGQDGPMVGKPAPTGKRKH
jgi:S-adenosylmethionine:diacylglycerol 3-amino-3-carboxypropyl transferase